MGKTQYPHPPRAGVAVPGHSPRSSPTAGQLHYRRGARTCRARRDPEQDVAVAIGAGLTVPGAPAARAEVDVRQAVVAGEDEIPGVPYLEKIAARNSVGAVAPSFP